MRSDDMAGDAKRRVPIQKKKEEINIMDIIDFHTHPYLTQEENACMYREGFSLEPEEAKEMEDRQSAILRSLYILR